MKNLQTPRTQMVGSVRRETQREYRIIPEGKCDGGGVGEAEIIRISACASGRATPLRNRNDMVRCHQAEQINHINLKQ